VKIRNYKDAREIMKRHDYRLITKTKNANGVSVKREKDGSWVMKVYVTKLLRSHRHLAALSLEGLPIKVVEAGEFKALLLRTDKWRPAPGGVSIGHPEITAGTLGCTVYKASKKYILSNNHVLANCNNANIGDPIYQPGPYDGGGVEDRIGVLHDFIPITYNDSQNPNYVDCALCEPDDESDVLDSLLDLGVLAGKKGAELGEQVTKSGRTTAITEEAISEFSGLMAIGYGTPGTAYFDDQILTPDMSAGGDSGSLVINKTTKEAVGLLFAGSPTITVMNRATRVAEELGFLYYGEQGVATLEGKYSIPFISRVLEGKYQIVCSRVLNSKYNILVDAPFGDIIEIRVGSSRFPVAVPTSRTGPCSIPLGVQLLW